MEDNFEVGDKVIANWTSGGFRFSAQAEIIKVNKKSYVTKLLKKPKEEASVKGLTRTSSYPVGWKITLPRPGGAGYSKNNCATSQNRAKKKAPAKKKATTKKKTSTKKKPPAKKPTPKKDIPKKFMISVYKGRGSARESVPVWTIRTAQWQSTKGVHQPWIAEIAPSQYAGLSKRGKKEYDKKRAKEWDASAKCKRDFADLVMEAYDEGYITLKTKGLSKTAGGGMFPDYGAEEIIKDELRDRKKQSRKRRLEIESKNNQIWSADQVQVGDRVYCLMFRDYGKVVKKFKKSVRVKYENEFSDKPRKTDILLLTWLSHDDLKKKVK